MSFLDTQAIKQPKKRSRLSWNLRESARRVLETIAPAVQITLAAWGSWAFAHYVLGHEIAFLSVTVAVTSLGLSRDARPKRIMQTGLGMVSGIAVSELFIVAFGHGIWQLPVLIFGVLLAARFVTNSATYALSAVAQSALVYLTVAPLGGPYTRTIDGLVGGTAALIATALIPRDPRGLARKDAEKLLEVFLESLHAIRSAMQKLDVASADATLLTIRRTQPLLDNWRMSLDSAISISQISPFLRRHRDELLDQTRLLKGMDLATRNLRVVVRRIDFLIRDGQPRPYLADLLQQIEDATKVLAEGIEDPERRTDALELYVEIIRQLDPKKHGIADQLREASVLLLLRPLLVDLLVAAGATEDEARAELPEI